MEVKKPKKILPHHGTQYWPTKFNLMVDYVAQLESRIEKLEELLDRK